MYVTVFEHYSLKRCAIFIRVHLMFVWGSSTETLFSSKNFCRRRFVLVLFFLLLVSAAVDLDLCSSNVQDAFVIAVEQQARERLERLSALKRITPVDMTKLSQQVSLIHPHKPLRTNRSLKSFCNQSKRHFLAFFRRGMWILSFRHISARERIDLAILFISVHCSMGCM